MHAPPPPNCPRCAGLPESDFTVFDPAPHVYDRMIFFPKEQLFHIHFGPSVQDEQLNTQEAQFIYDWMMKRAAEQPDKNFFVIVDGSQGDDSEMITDESRKIYAKILKHPQFGQGVFYGLTPGMHFYINLLLRITGKKIRIVSSVEEAEQEYQKWWDKKSQG